MKIAVLISGGGTTLKNLLERHSLGSLPVEFGLVVSSRRSAGGLRFAEQAGIPTRILSRRAFGSPQEHSAAVFDACRAAGVELVVMGGYLEHLLIAPDFMDRVINIHPSLIPAFCGHGFYGLRVHRAVLEYGAKVSGCTVHFVDNEYDHGPIIAQRCCPVESGDTPESLQARVFRLECELYPSVITAIANGRVSVAGRQVSLQPNSSYREPNSP